MFGTDATGVKKILKLYYDMDVSESFFNCAASHLRNDFERIIGSPGLIEGVWLGWSPGEARPIYEIGEVSTFSATLWLSYGKVPITFCWQSLSGRIYQINDISIQCEDIRFWFQELDRDACMRYLKPNWSLITFPETKIPVFEKESGITFSMSFLRCADNQLSSLFKKATDIKLIKSISLYPTRSYASQNGGCE